MCNVWYIHCVYCIVYSVCMIYNDECIPGLKNSSSCQPCRAGHYCDGPGLTEPRGKCDPGFYCRLGAYTSVCQDSCKQEW